MAIPQLLLPLSMRRSRLQPSVIREFPSAWLVLFALIFSSDISVTSDQQAEGKLELEAAKSLVRETGAVLFENFINATGVEHGHTGQVSTRAS